MTSEKLSVIIIDDDEYVLGRLTELLGEVYECYTAKTAREGLELFRRYADEKPLVICDVDLPDRVGFDVCKTIKSTHPRIYVMLFTGFNSKALRISGLNAYADICLDKSIDDSEIKLLVRNAHNTMQPRVEIEEPGFPVGTGSHVDVSDFEVNVDQYIADYFRKPEDQRTSNALALPQVAAHFNLTERTFQRRIKTVTGRSFVKYLALKRVERSKDLLAANYSVTQISEILEFSSPSHFSREFKKTTQMTPNKYKSTIRAL